MSTATIYVRHIVHYIKRKQNEVLRVHIKIHTYLTNCTTFNALQNNFIEYTLFLCLELLFLEANYHRIFFHLYLLPTDARVIEII